MIALHTTEVILALCVLCCDFLTVGFWRAGDTTQSMQDLEHLAQYLAHSTANDH